MSNESVKTTELCLWTVWADYFATGEGRTILGLICSASSPQDARQRFGEFSIRSTCRVAMSKKVWSGMRPPSFCGLAQR
jgi:hypothetical protein